MASLADRLDGAVQAKLHPGEEARSLVWGQTQKSHGWLLAPGGAMLGLGILLWLQGEDAAAGPLLRAAVMLLAFGGTAANVANPFWILTVTTQRRIVAIPLSGWTGKIKSERAASYPLGAIKMDGDVLVIPSANGRTLRIGLQKSRRLRRLCDDPATFRNALAR